MHTCATFPYSERPLHVTHASQATTCFHHHSSSVDAFLAAVAMCSMLQGFESRRIALAVQQSGLRVRER